jgi:hypothetical protein
MSSPPSSSSVLESFAISSFCRNDLRGSARTEQARTEDQLLNFVRAEGMRASYVSTVRPFSSVW